MASAFFALIFPEDGQGRAVAPIKLHKGEEKIGKMIDL